MQTQREKSTIIVRDFNTLLTSMNRSSRPDRRLIKKRTSLKRHNSLDGLRSIYRTFHSKAAEYTFFSSAHGTFLRIPYMLHTKEALVNLRKLESYQASFLTTLL